MATATADHETKTETVTFASISPNQRLTRRPQRRISDGMGGTIVQSEEEWLEEQHARNRARVDNGDEPLPVDDTPWAVQFENHEFSTDHPGLIAWLRGHKDFRSNQTGGFYEIEPSPDSLRPTVIEQAQAIGACLATNDTLGVEAIIQAEQETHNRPVVLEAAESALARINGESPEPGDVAEPTGNGDSNQPHGSNDAS